MPNRGSINRRTGKTTPRRKARTHWGAKKGSGSRSPVSKKGAKAGASSSAKS